MSNDAAVSTSSGATNEHDSTVYADEAHDISDGQYIVIALLLAVLTAAEVAVSYLDIGGWLIPVLLVMMTVKFFTIVGYFMHLKFDNRLFKMVFYIGLGLAVGLFSIMLATFQFFTP